MFERVMTGLHAGLVIALTTLALMSMLFGADFELLAARHAHADWVCIVIWLVVSGAIAMLPTVMMMWRTGLYAGAAMLVATAIAGIWYQAPHAAAMAIALCIAAALLIFFARKLHARPVQRLVERNAAMASMHMQKQIDWVRRISWWVLALSMAEAFRLAQFGSSGAVKGIGSVGMLLCFFVMLPSLSVSTWFPRLASFVWMLSCLILAAIGWNTFNVSVLCGVLLVGGCAVMLSRVRPHDMDGELPL